MMSKTEVVALKLQLYDSREKLVAIMQKETQRTELINLTFDLILQIYTDKIEILNTILNHKK